MAIKRDVLVHSQVKITVQWKTGHRSGLRRSLSKATNYINVKIISQNHLLEGLGPTGVTRLDVVILPTEAFLRFCWESEFVVPKTFFARAAVGFM